MIAYSYLTMKSKGVLIFKVNDLLSGLICIKTYVYYFFSSNVYACPQNTC